MRSGLEETQIIAFLTRVKTVVSDCFLNKLTLDRVHMFKATVMRLAKLEYIKPVQDY